MMLAFNICKYAYEYQRIQVQKTWDELVKQIGPDVFYSTQFKDT